MLFNSIQFLFFFPIVTFLYFLFPNNYRWLLLLAASCYFYMFFIPYYILILAFTIIIDYFSGILIQKTRDQNKKKYFLIGSLIANIGILAFFKYFNFFIDNLNAFFYIFNEDNLFGRLSIVLPIGLSFHTFQAMSYTIEVYRGNQKAERHFGIYALYVMFYPQLVAGPIERPQNILHQLHEKQVFNYERLISGLRFILWGLFKKVVIADTLSTMVGPFYNDVASANGWQLLLATYCFSIQIYCDFSGYSDIAIGGARLLGINLMRNFNVPYFSTSISEFWTRWHISLSGWFKDYLYIPLGGNRKGKLNWMRNLVIVFLISGLWHGANWTFVAWGGIHAGYIIIGIVLSSIIGNYKFGFINSGSRIIRFLKIFITFHLAAFAWIFFRANSVPDAITIIGKIYFSLHDIPGSIKSIFDSLSGSSIIVFVVCFIALYSEIKLNFYTLKFSAARNYWFFITIFLLIILLGKSTQEQFIYFQF